MRSICCPSQQLKQQYKYKLNETIWIYFNSKKSRNQLLIHFYKSNSVQSLQAQKQIQKIFDNNKKFVYIPYPQDKNNHQSQEIFKLFLKKASINQLILQICNEKICQNKQFLTIQFSCPSYMKLNEQIIAYKAIIQFLDSLRKQIQQLENKQSKLIIAVKTNWIPYLNKLTMINIIQHIQNNRVIQTLSSQNTQQNEKQHQNQQKQQKKLCKKTDNTSTILIQQLTMSSQFDKKYSKKMKDVKMSIYTE